MSEERVVEVRESSEEVVVRREGAERTETVRDTVRKEEVDIERESDRR
jgi:stress response protein YsnF